MVLHAQRTIDTRMVAWPAQRMTSNDRGGKKLYDADKVELWRSLGARAFRTVPPISDGHVARVVAFYRQPKGRSVVKDPSNLHPITKALVDGITHGPAGTRNHKGPWPDDSLRYVLAQDERALLPHGELEVIVQVWTAPQPGA